MNYNSGILKSSNNNKSTWDIIILEPGKNFSNGDIRIGYISKGNLLATNKQFQMLSIIIFFLQLTQLPRIIYIISLGLTKILLSFLFIPKNSFTVKGV